MQQRTGLRAEAPVVKATVEIQEETDELFNAEMRQQLDTIFARMEHSILLNLHLDERPLSKELEQFILEIK